MGERGSALEAFGRKEAPTTGALEGLGRKEAPTVGGRRGALPVFHVTMSMDRSIVRSLAPTARYPCTLPEWGMPSVHAVLPSCESIQAYACQIQRSRMLELCE